MHSELSEALEELRKGKAPNDPKVAEEFADVIIRILDYAEGVGMDIGTAVAMKINKNAMRPHRHGGKAF
jgi:NTP pyrophosphatase (non-canonical NTP hydrolase)